MVNRVTNFWNFKHKINIQNIKHEKYISPMEYKSNRSIRAKLTLFSQSVKILEKCLHLAKQL